MPLERLGLERALALLSIDLQVCPLIPLVNAQRLPFQHQSLHFKTESDE